MSSSVDDCTTSPSNAKDESLNFTNILYISPHRFNTKEIKIWDITSSITESYPSERFAEQSEQVGQAQVDNTPSWIIQNPGRHKPKTLHLGSDRSLDEETALTIWKPSRTSVSSNTFSFPSDSPHSSHNLVMARPKWYKTRTETFVQDSIEYTWRWDGHSRRRFTLWRVRGQEETAVAKYSAPYRLTRRGGTLLVNAEHVNIVITIVSCVANLLKVKQAE
jgi:hypothetical protein